MTLIVISPNWGVTRTNISSIKNNNAFHLHFTSLNDKLLKDLQCSNYSFSPYSVILSNYCSHSCPVSTDHKLKRIVHKVDVFSSLLHQYEPGFEPLTFGTTHCYLAARMSQVHFSVELACSPRVYVGLIWAPWFPLPQKKKGTRIVSKKRLSFLIKKFQKIK